uniref:WAC domain-containing protein n=1 Tax=Ciona savignyi TaxID=51511 RepID=H2Z6I1_CIOSA
KMPMLGRKTFDGGSPSLGGIESKFVIPHTKEAFGDEEEYTERMNLYDKKIWTCQCTGHSNHTHLGATLSEASCREKLAQTYDEIWEEPVLKLVHHSFSPLESIVVQANNTLLTTLVHGETVKFTVNKTDETNHDGKEDSVKSEVGENSSDAKKILNSVSPSSDKENKRQSLITDIFKTGKLPNSTPLTPPPPDIRRSARSPSTIVRSGVSLKGKRPKIIPAKYNILLVEENKIVSKVPSEHLTRTMKPPNRDQIRLFIRSNSIRPLSSKKKVPWMVNEDLVFRYKLPSRVPEEEIVDILQLCSVTTQQYLHGSDTSISNGHCNGDVIDVDDCDETSKKRKGEKLQSQSKKAKRDSLLLKETKSSLDAFLKKTTKLFSEKIGEIDGKSARQQGSPRKSTSPKKKKQATILELTKKGGIKMVSSRPPAKSRGSKTPKAQPLIVLQLVALKKEKRFRAHKYKLTITAACKILTEKQRENLPPEVKEDVLAKWEMVEFKRKYDSMSASERKEFLAQRRREKQAPLGGVVSDKFEDQHLTRAASFSFSVLRFEAFYITFRRQLPSMELVELPESLPNTAFGNVAMVCEFLHTYHQLLAPKDPGFHKQFHFHNIIEAVTLGRNGQQCQVTEMYQDFYIINNQLFFIRVTPSVCCELVRICLRQNDEDVDEGKSDSSSDAGFSDAELSDSVSGYEFLCGLAGRDFHMLPNQQVEVLAALAYRVMNTYAVQIHIEDTSEKATTIYKKVLQHKKEKKMTEVPKIADPSPIEPFLVKPNNEEDVMDEGIDLISRVKKRKLLSEKHRRAEEERRKKVREQEERILREQKSKQEQAKADRQLEETRTLARHLRRRLPLGTDRNHSRYWLFCDGIPGFYIEKGWVNDHVDYSTHPETLNIQGIPRTPKNSGVNHCPVANTDSNSKLNLLSHSLIMTQAPKEEVTWPHMGQNLWYSIETQEQLDQLVSSLCKTGIRESRLIKSIEKNYDLII